MSVNTIPRIRVLVVLAAVHLLGACASPPGGRHGGHHPGSPAKPAVSSPAGASSAQGGTAGGATTQSAPCCAMMGGDKPAGSGGMQHMDKEAMCAMYRGMRDASNEQARQSMMDRHMQSMSPALRQQHMEMMRQRCQ